MFGECLKCIYGVGGLDAFEGQDRTGQTRTGQVRTGQVRTSQDKLDRVCQTRTGHVQLGQGCVILEDVKLSQTGQVKLNRSSQKILTQDFLNTKSFLIQNIWTQFFSTYFFGYKIIYKQIFLELIFFIY